MEAEVALVILQGLAVQQQVLAVFGVDDLGGVDLDAVGGSLALKAVGPENGRAPRSSCTS